MPPPLPADSDAESVAADDVTDSRPEPVEGEEEVAAVTAEGEEEEEDDGDEEVYVVEKILRHHDDFEDNAMRYLIKWKGYERKVDLTWETEENLAGAREILEVYWQDIGGKPEPSFKGNKPAGKKRGRQSTGNQPEAAKKKQKRGRKSTSNVQDKDDANDEFPPGFTDVDPESWKPPAPEDNAWEDLVMQVDTIEKDNDDMLWAYLVWNEKNDDGRFNRTKARLATCNRACPQKMLSFYEKHVVFTNNKTNYMQENGAMTA
ncbi:MAG: hypothetical protein LQ345_002008 [Seirophora villosa]|nr:MAG: hypothetical protein LQ345_002008 [Seirophora villosa]